MVAQRLVRVLCARCVEPYEPAAKMLMQLGSDAEEFKGRRLMRGHGCQDCHGTGYRGRVGIFEMLVAHDAIREVIMTRPSGNQIRRAAGPDFAGMRADGYRKVREGLTSLEEVWRVTQDATEENGALAAH